MVEIIEYVAGEYEVNGWVVNPAVHVKYIDGDKVGIYDNGQMRYIIQPTIFSDWLDPSGTPYASLADLIADLNTFFFDLDPIGQYPEVNTFADLPDPALNTGVTYHVLTATGLWILGTRRQSGLYRSNGSEWILRNDISSLLVDSEFNIRDDADTTKGIRFILDGLTTGVLRAFTWPDKDGTIATLDDVGVQSVSSGLRISVDNTDPANPIINIEGATDSQIDSNTSGVADNAAAIAQEVLDRIAGDTGNVSIHGDVNINSPVVGEILVYDGSNWVNISLTYFDIVFAAAVDYDGSEGTRQQITVTGDVTINDPINILDGAEVILKIIQDSTGGHLVTFGSGWRTKDGVLNVSTSGDSVTIIRGIYDAVSDTVDLHSVAEDILPELHFGTFDDLLLWYLLDDPAGTVSVQDSSNTGANGTAFNAPTFEVAGYFRTACEFDGVNQYIENLSAAITDPISGSSNWAVHFRASAAASLVTFQAAISINQLGGMDPDDGTIAFYPYSSTDGLTNAFRLWYNGAYILDINNAAPANGSFNSFFVVQRSTTLIEVWINGVLAGTVNPAASVDAGIDSFVVGSYQSAFEFYDGIVDDVRLYGNADRLTATVIPLIQNVPSF